MIFSKIYQDGDIIAKVVNTSTGLIESYARIVRVNGVILVAQDTIADATTVKPLVGREYLNTLVAGINGKTITWLNSFDPNNDIAKVATSAESALAYGITLGQSQISGVLVTASNYTVLRTSIISSDYVESPVNVNSLLNDPNLLGLVIINKVYAKVLRDNNLLQVANKILADGAKKA